MVYSYEEFLGQLGKRLRQLRDERRWTLRHLMQTYGFHLAQWQGFEKGVGISVPTLLRLCAIFNITLEELIGGLGRSETLSQGLESRHDVRPSKSKRSPQPVEKA